MRYRLHNTTKKDATIKTITATAIHYFKDYSKQIEWAENRTDIEKTFLRLNNKWLPELEF